MELLGDLDSHEDEGFYIGEKGQANNKNDIKVNVVRSKERVTLSEVHEKTYNDKNDSFPIASPKRYPAFTVFTSARVPRHSPWPKVLQSVVCRQPLLALNLISGGHGFLPESSYRRSL